MATATAAHIAPILRRAYSPDVDASLIKDLLAKNQPLRIETASGRVFDIPHPDFVAFSRNRTALSIFFEENGEQHFAIVPLLTVTAAITPGHPTNNE